VDYDDFGEVTESKFIELLRSAKVINKDKKIILDEKLKKRNMAAHPTSMKIRESKVIEFIEDLVENVLS
jgi:hypothetical protein